MSHHQQRDEKAERMNLAVEASVCRPMSETAKVCPTSAFPYRPNKFLWLAGALATFFLTLSFAGLHALTTPKSVGQGRRLMDKTNGQETNAAFKQRASGGALSDAARDKLYQELAIKTSLPLPLQPPYRIVEVGQKRSGSTFQFQLLDAIAQVKSKGEYKVEFLGYLKKSIKISKEVDVYPESFVAKTHGIHDLDLAQAQRDGKLLVFTSGFIPSDDMYGIGLHNQRRSDLERCSMCEIDKYQPIFGLTDEELSLVKEYMSAYEKIRQCCGMQMSHAERARLNGCDMTLVKKWSTYPHCELVDKQAEEQKMVSFQDVIEHRANSPKDNWSQMGDCAKFDAKIAAGETRTGRKYKCPYP